MDWPQHFPLAELTASDYALRHRLPNLPGPEALGNLRRLAALLEGVRALLGKPILVNSAFRSQEVNRGVGGSAKSQHVTGQAADFRVAGMSPREVVQAIRQSALAYDQVIEEFGRWTHLSIPAEGSLGRLQALVIDHNGSRPFA